jgi:carboxymethylenebutenolidase
MTLDLHQRYLIEEFAEDYLEARMSRRDMMKRVLIITGSVPLTATTLLALGCGSGSDAEPTPPPQPTTPPLATTAAGIGPGVAPNDPAIQASDVSFAGPASQLLGYLARPTQNGTYPGVLVIHENQGLLDHFKDVARRFAKEGFAALAVDMASRAGGSKPDPSANTGLLRLTAADAVADLTAYLNYLKSQPFVKANALGVTGFCMGGGYTFEIAVSNRDVKAAVPYYGTAPLDRLGETSAAVLAIYGETDTRLTAQAPTVEQNLRAAGKTVEVKVYPGAGHAFFNETKTAYHEASAKDAWTQTLAWFRRHLATA